MGLKWLYEYLFPKQPEFADDATSVDSNAAKPSE